MKQVTVLRNLIIQSKLFTLGWIIAFVGSMLIIFDLRSLSHIEPSFEILHIEELVKLTVFGVILVGISVYLKYSEWSHSEYVEID